MGLVAVVVHLLGTRGLCQSHEWLGAAFSALHCAFCSSSRMQTWHLQKWKNLDGPVEQVISCLRGAPAERRGLGQAQLQRHAKAMHQIAA